MGIDGKRSALIHGGYALYAKHGHLITFFMQDDSLEQAIRERSRETASSAPLIFNVRNPEDRTRISALFHEHKIQHVIDDYEEQLREYFQVTNPTLVYAPDFETRFQEYKKGEAERIPLWQHGRWVYFPWNSTLAHILESEAFQRVRTARNQNLITGEEQKKFYGSVIGIAGLSVGNSVALSIVLQGGGGHMRLADHDRLALSNTNRVRAGVESLGIAKTDVAAREIYAINPYANLELFPEGLTKETIGRFFEGPPKLDVVIDEIDNLGVKCLIREHAKRLRVPVIMATDNGDNGLVDIERYDLDPDLEYFHGRLGNATYEAFAHLDKREVGRMISRYVGPENVAQRMQESLLEIGKTIVSWPQLGGAALLNSVAVAYCVRRILNSQPIESNRAFVSLDETLDPTYNTPESKENRHNTNGAIQKTLRNLSS